MQRLVTNLALICLLCFTAFRCEQEDFIIDAPYSCSPSGGMEGTWRLQAYQHIDSRKLEEDPEPNGRGVVLTFKEDGDKGTIQGHTVANQVGGGYQKADACQLLNVTFGGTKVAEPTAWSAKAWTAMNSATGYEIYRNKGQKDQLSIFFNNRSERMIFVKQ
ncbi:META domain-containing protein [Telluribacter sp. SYSU D00476]|uniref:META domain-containing protein n=1 Tax=Telluribacter sp. SYSU D00476 TaxID=2811430 RepID=UPI001FF58554|nr:META domain-containing protein [Telluribacter sp. SYSU D00476]